MRDTFWHTCLSVVTVCLTISVARAQSTPAFSLKVTGILDANFNTKPCPSCGFGPGSGATELPLGEALPGDTLKIEAYAFDWDPDPLLGFCNSGSACRTDQPNSCTTFHCTDNNAQCFPAIDICNNDAACVQDTCRSDPVVGSFQWTLDPATLYNGGPGTVALARQPCDADKCLQCQDDPFNQGGPGGACDLCACFHRVAFACFGQCTCCGGGLGGLACPPDTGICQDSAEAYIDLSSEFWILQGGNATVAVFPDAFEWIGADLGRGGTAQGGFPSYMGTVFLTLPDCAGGRYEINFVDDSNKSFLNDNNANKLPVPRLEPVVINLVEIDDPCVGVVCDDGDLCTANFCDNSTCGSAFCRFEPVVCDPPEWVCNPGNGLCEDVLGACCQPQRAGTCSNETAAACNSQSGSFKGVGSRCETPGVCDAPVACTTLIADSPPNCAIDARQPSTIDGVTQQGWTSINVAVGPSGCLVDVGDLEVLSDGVLGIAGVSQLGDVATVTFDSIIPTEFWTCVSLFSDSNQQACVAFLPGDVDSDRASNPALDLGAEIDCINNPGTCADWQENADRVGIGAGVLDITRVIDLFNGAGSYQSWTGANLGSTCPSE